MIVSFIDKHTAKVWLKEKTKKWSPDIQKTALRKLFLIHAASDISNLKIPPGNNLHKLKGDKCSDNRLSLMMENIQNIHPGKILKKEFLEPMGLSAYRLSREIGVQQTRISQILNEKRSITADTAIRLSKFFGTTEEFWMNLQREYDLRKEHLKKKADFEKIQKFEFN